MLFAIKDRLVIPGRGVAAVGLVPIGDELFRVGDPIVVRRLDGSCVQTRMAGIEWVSPPRPDKAFAVMFPPELTKDDLPLGAEVWSVDP